MVVLEFNQDKMAEKLSELRKQSGKTLEVAAKDLGISVSALSAYENGDRVPRDKVKARIAAYYKKPLTTIFFVKSAHETCSMEK